MKVYKYPHPFKPGKLVSRQRIKQLSWEAEGLCRTCGRKASVNSLFCSKHKLRNAIATRTAYRIAHGISLSKHGYKYK